MEAHEQFKHKHARARISKTLGATEQGTLPLQPTRAPFTLSAPCCVATTGAPPNTHTNSNTEDSHVTNCNAGIQKHQKVLAAQQRLAKLPSELVLLALAASKATYCCAPITGNTGRNDKMYNFYILPPLKLSGCESGQDVNPQRPCNLNPTPTNQDTAETPPHPPPPPHLAENLPAGEKHSCTWAASARRRFAHAQCNLGRGLFCKPAKVSPSNKHKYEIKWAIAGKTLCQPSRATKRFEKLRGPAFC